MPGKAHRSAHSAKKLFDEPARPSEVWRANVDGASRGNPGPASYAAIVRKPSGEVAARIGKYIGRATNNVAEYYGLIAALDFAAANGITRLRVESDSELLVRQMQGRYKVKSADLKPLCERARKIAGGLAYFEIVHVPRERNAEADALGNETLDQTSGVGAASTRSPARTAEKDAGAGAAAARAIRACFWDGVIVPEESLDLRDGDKLEVTFRKLSSP